MMHNQGIVLFFTFVLQQDVLLLADGLPAVPGQRHMDGSSRDHQVYLMYV
jgi:hypothetical protein